MTCIVTPYKYICILIVYSYSICIYTIHSIYVYGYINSYSLCIQYSICIQLQYMYTCIVTPFKYICILIVLIIPFLHLVTILHTHSQVAQMVKSLPTMQETQLPSLGWEDPLEKKMATHFSMLVWRIPWREVLAGNSP